MNLQTFFFRPQSRPSSSQGCSGMVDIDENTNLSTSQLFLATLTAITLRNKSNTSASGKKKKKRSSPANDSPVMPRDDGTRRNDNGHHNASSTPSESGQSAA